MPRSMRRAFRAQHAELAVLVALSLLSLAFLGALIERGGELTWIEGFQIADQAQWLTWVRESGERLLVGNRFDLTPGDAVLVHPVGLVAPLHLLGVSPAVAYLAWKPVAVAVLFYGVWRWTRRMLDDPWERAAALAVALLFAPPVAALGTRLFGAEDDAVLAFISGEVWPPGYLWGYPMTALALGLMVIAFLRAERALAAERPARDAWIGAAAAFGASATHPWQGLILLGVLGAACAWQAAAREAPALELVRRLWPVALGATVPAAYYALLTVVDDSWARTAEVYRDDFDRWPLWLLGLALLPLVLPALPGYRGESRSLQERILRVWPGVALLLYLLPFGTFPFHAFNGISIPLSVLAVRALAPWVRATPSPGRAPAEASRRPRTRLRAALVALGILVLVLPGAADRVRLARAAVQIGVEPYVLQPGEADALDALEGDPRGGGVLASVHLGQLVPPQTGRETWVGHPSWTPNFGDRAGRAAALLAGELDDDAARDLVRSSGATFLLARCGEDARLERRLGSLVQSKRRFGCATLYEL
jgi:hypothetical protein